MRRNFVPLAVSLIHYGPQLVQREGGNVVEHAVIPHPVAAIRIDFDPVRAIHDLFAYGLARLVGSIHHLNSMRYGNVRGIPC